MNQAALTLDGITSGYRTSVVLRDLTLNVQKGEAIALLGKNGMGKSTLLKTVMGYLAKRTGTIHMHGTDITGLPPHRIARQGMAYAAQEQPLFADLSVRDNLRLGLVKEAQFQERFAMTDRMFPVFKKRLQQYAGTLSGGEQKMLLLARSLMMRPSVMLLDEITEGLQPSVIDLLANALRQERQQRGTTMLIVEQNVPFALQVADRYLILKQGELVEDGSTKASGAMQSIFRHLRV
jgi:ABC-type branched-subunit amino acid transport system ATPase component